MLLLLLLALLGPAKGCLGEEPEAFPPPPPPTDPPDPCQARTQENYGSHSPNFEGRSFTRKTNHGLMGVCTCLLHLDLEGGGIWSVRARRAGRAWAARVAPGARGASGEPGGLLPTLPCPTILSERQLCRWARPVFLHWQTGNERLQLRTKQCFLKDVIVPLNGPEGEANFDSGTLQFVGGACDL